MGTDVIDPAGHQPVSFPVTAWMAGLGTALLGLLALIGWAVDGQRLKQGLPGLTSMRPIAAVALILLAIAVTALIRPPSRRWVCVTAAVGAGLIAGVSLLEYALDEDLLVDGLLFPEAVEREPFGGRMALATAVELLVMTLALLAAAAGRLRAAQGLGLLGFTVGAVAVLGYAYGERRLYATDAQAGMAFNTALGLSLVALSLLAAIPNSVLSHLFSRPAPGAPLARRLLPWFTLGMPVIGWLRIEAERRGWFGTGLGTSIMVFAGSILVAVIARLAAISMDRLAHALNHAWHQYGLVSAGEHSQIQEPAPCPTCTADLTASDLDEGVQHLSLDR